MASPGRCLHACGSRHCHLVKGGEQHLALLGAQSGTRVLHVDCQLPLPVGALPAGGGHSDTSSLGKLHGIAQQIHQNLPEPGRVYLDDLGNRVARTEVRTRPLLVALARIMLSSSRSTLVSEVSTRSRVILSASILERSRMSLMIVRRCVQHF